MEAMRKLHYEAPSTNVVEVKQERIVCASPLTSVKWLIIGDDGLSSEQEWGRDGYGTAQTF